MTALDELGQDIRYGLRALRRTPGFTMIVLLSLALGIGASTAIFSVVRATLLEPLPFADADHVVRVWSEHPANDIHDGAVSEPDFLDWRAASTRASSMAGYFSAGGAMGVDLTGDGTPTRVSAALVTDGFFETLGAHAMLGRTLTTEDQLAGRNRVVVLGHALWTSRFGGDRAIVGRAVQLNGQAFTVVGVMPPDFTYPADRPLDSWIPLSVFGPDDIGRARGAGFLSVVARLKAGVTPAQFDGELTTVATRLAQQYPDNPGWTGVRALPIRESIVGEVERPLTLLLGATLLVLLITCANVAGLLLARASTRARELAVRAALGAGRPRIIRGLLTESLVLALGGGVLGALVAAGALALLLQRGDVTLPRNAAAQLDNTALLFAIGVSLVAGMLFGIVPAFRATGTLDRALRAGGRGSIGAGGTRLRQGLVVAQVALAVVLVTAAGLTTKSFTHLLSVNMGFDPSHALVVKMSVPDRFTTPDAMLGYYEQVVDAVRRVPGVTAVGVARDLPTQGNGEMRRPDIAGVEPGDGPTVQLHHISTDFFAAMQIPVKAGRVFTQADRDGAPPVTVVNETLARRWWPGEPPVGKSLRIGDASLAVVGVVGDVRQRGPAEAADPAMYIHVHQNVRSGMSIVVRTTSDDAASLAPAVRAAIWAVNPDQTIAYASTLEQIVGRAVSRPRLLASLFALFGVLGLSLGTLGIYGVLAFAVTQRRQEIGIRVALGAAPRAVLHLIVRQGMMLAGVGVVIGMVGALALAGTMQAVLFGVPAADVRTFAQTCALLLLAAAVASWIPARRALAIDPAVALREE